MTEHNARYLKTEEKVLFELFPTATIEEIMAKLPGRAWIAVSAHARRLGLHRTKIAKGNQIIIGRQIPLHTEAPHSSPVKAGGEMWKTELDTLRAIAGLGKTNVIMHDVVALFPNLLPRSVYYRVDKLVEHGLIKKEKVSGWWIALSITPEGEVMLK